MITTNEQVFYTFEIKRDHDHDWGFGDIPKDNQEKLNTIHLFEDFDSAFSEVFNFFKHITNTFRGKDYLVESLKYFLDFISDNLLDSNLCCFETMKNGTSIYFDFNKYEESFNFDFDGGNSKFSFEIKQTKIKLYSGGKKHD